MTTEYEFTLVFRDIDVESDEVMTALFSAGCDDALFGLVRDVAVARFSRSASSFFEAVTGAVDAVLSAVPGSSFVSVDGPSSMVTASDLAEISQRSSESIRLLINGDRGDQMFPTPVARVEERSPLFRLAEVRRHFSDDETWLIGEEQADVTELVNCYLLINSNPRKSELSRLCSEAAATWCRANERPPYSIEFSENACAPDDDLEEIHHGAQSWMSLSIPCQ